MGLTELYNSIVDDVVENVKEAFSEEGVDEQILKTLKESWLRRIRESQQPRQPTITQQPQQQQQQQPLPPPPQQQQQLLPQHQPLPPQQITDSQQQQPLVYQQQQQTTLRPHPQQLQQQQQQQPQHSQQNFQPQQASVIVFNNNYQQPTPQQIISSSSMGGGNNFHASAALNLSQQHRQQLVAEINPNANTVGQGTDNKSHTQQQQRRHIPQLDGSNGTSDEDEDNDESEGDFGDNDDDADVDLSDDEDKETDTNRDDEDPLNSGDDVSNDESSEMFETDNVVVCQFDKITRNRNKWKFHLKDGIMNINGRDYVFQKAVGDGEW